MSDESCLFGSLRNGIPSWPPTTFEKCNSPDPFDAFLVSPPQGSIIVCKHHSLLRNILLSNRIDSLNTPIGAPAPMRNTFVFARDSQARIRSFQRHQWPSSPKTSFNVTLAVCLLPAASVMAMGSQLPVPSHVACGSQELSW